MMCALLFVATAINFADRQILGVLAIPLAHDLHWTDSQHEYIVTAFQGAYAAGLIAFGAAIDRVGTGLGLAASVSAPRL